MNKIKLLFFKNTRISNPSSILNFVFFSKFDDRFEDFGPSQFSHDWRPPHGFPNLQFPPIFKESPVNGVGVRTRKKNTKNTTFLSFKQENFHCKCNNL